MENDIYEKLYDVTADCGCYELGDVCYDRVGDPTHASSEECNN